MNLQSINPEDLSPNPWNTNSVSPEDMTRLTASLERHGWVKPVLARKCDGDLQILGGQHRVEAAKSLGYSTVPVVILEEMPDHKAKEIGLIDNARYGQDDALGLADLIADLGGIAEIGDFLPVGEEDILSLGVSLEDDDIDDLLEDEDQEPERVEERTKPVKTHRILRFKAGIEDADAISDMIEQVMREQGMTESDALTNAGDALVHVLGEWSEYKLQERSDD